MAQKKKWIYGSTLLVFFILILCYSRAMVLASKNAARERIQNAVLASSNSTARALEYEIKDLQLAASGDVSRYLNGDFEAQLKAYEYWVDVDGTLQNTGGDLNGLKLDPLVLHSADASGHAVTAFANPKTQSQYWTITAPLDWEKKGYLARCYPIEIFLELIAKNVAFSTNSLYLFNHWGNLEGSVSLTQTDTQALIMQSVVDGAGAYSYTAQTDPNGIIETQSSYNVYFEILEPQGWFIGAQVDGAAYADGFFGNAPWFVAFIFSTFVLIFIVVIAIDVINEKELKHKLKNANSTDLLTGLVNSIGMQDAVDRFMEKRSDEKLSMVCLDVVAFSRINSMFGFALGDQLLKIIAEVLESSYFVGVRVSADGFFCLAKGLNFSCEVLDRELREAVERKMGAEYLQVINFKFGSYPITQYKSEDFREIYEGALLALKNAKKNPNSNYVVYDETLRKSGELLRNIELNMMHALSKEEFVMYVQPQMSLPEEICDRGEALIRWDSECMGFISPDKFVPVFETNGFIVETDFFMISAAMQFLQDRIDQGKKLVTIAVNQSKVTITFPNYYQRLQQLVAQYPGVPLAHIELEITESALENNWGTIVPLIHRVKKMGFSIAMDDFGSGFSSLNTLRILPIDILKIDREFLRESDQSERARVIIRHVILMAKDLNIKIVCEGVETQAHLQFLKECGCDIAQGYYYSRPIPLEQFEGRYCGEKICKP